MHTLEAMHLSKTIKKTNIIREISIRVQSGEVVGLLGPNGAGKTTTFYIICGLLRASSGKVCFDSQEITGLSLHKRAQLGIGYNVKSRKPQLLFIELLVRAAVPDARNSSCNSAVLVGKEHSAVCKAEGVVYLRVELAELVHIQVGAGIGIVLI